MKFSKKKIVALGLTLVMAVGMSVTSMATSVNENNRYALEVDIDANHNGLIDSGEVYNIELNSDGSGVVMNSDGTIATTFSKYVQPGTHTIENAAVATAFDAIYGTGLIVNAANQPQQYFETEYLDTTTWQGTGNYGIAFDTINGYKATSTENEDGSTHYEFWELFIQPDNGTLASAANYATNYKASDISKVVVLMSSFDY